MIVNKFGSYKCICGKEFSSTQSLRAHMSSCIMVLGEEKYQLRVNQRKSALKLATEAAAKRQEEISLSKFNENKANWESSTHYCEKCGKELPHNYEDVFGTGRFCSSSCANSHEYSDETKKKIALSCEINPWHCKRSLNGYYRGIYCASSFELLYLVYNLDNNINITRCEDTFKYNYKGKDHIYIPDFYLRDYDTYVEIKGKAWDINEINKKLEAVRLCNKKIIILYEGDLKDAWSFCKDKYCVKNYRDLCELLYEDKIASGSYKKTSWNRGENNFAYGKHWFTNGSKNILDYECPEGFYKGMTVTRPSESIIDDADKCQ